MDSPFLPLRFDEFFWEGEDVLDSWAGFQTRQGPYTSVSDARPSDGRARVLVAPPGDEAARRPPAPEQLAAYAHLNANEAAVARAVQDAVLGYAKGLDAEYGVPNDLDLGTLRDRIGLGVVHVLSVARDGFAYVGFELGRAWDGEHDCGVMTHAGRIVAVGQADESFEEWIAEEDGGVALE